MKSLSKVKTTKEKERAVLLALAKRGNKLAIKLLEKNHKTKFKREIWIGGKDENEI